MGVCTSRTLSAADRTFLQNATLETVPVFSLEGQQGWGKIVSLYDGDTGKLAVYKPFRTTFTFRLVGLDCEELKQPKNGADREKKTAFALEARNALCGMTTSILIDDNYKNKGNEWKEKISTNSKLIYYTAGGWDKYGRVLLTLWEREADQCVTSINDTMLSRGFGVSYDGGTKSEVVDTRQVFVQ